MGLASCIRFAVICSAIVWICLFLYQSSNAFLPLRTSQSQIPGLHLTRQSIKRARSQGLAQSEPEASQDNYLKRNPKSLDRLQSIIPFEASEARNERGEIIADGKEEERCAGMHVHVYEELAASVNGEATAGCGRMAGGYDMCAELENEGRGRVIEELCELGESGTDRSGAEERKGASWEMSDQKEAVGQSLVSRKSAARGFESRVESGSRTRSADKCDWFDTNQFSLEVLLHHRLRKHPCRVKTPAEAQLFFVPIYTGLQLMHHWGDSSAAAHSFDRVFDPLIESPWFLRKGGRDHFVAMGRMGMEFGFYDGFVTRFANVTKLMIEAGWNPEGFRTGREIGVPYPTAIHPAKLADVKRHQARAAGAARDVLVSYAGAVNRPYGLWGQLAGTAQLRTRVATECTKVAGRCRHIICGLPGHDCSSRTILALFMRSTFCLQPPGDSPTRRSTFEALLAGCIPIFFHRDSFETQYADFLGVNTSLISIFIPQDRIYQPGWSLEAELNVLDAGTITKMRNSILELVPRIVYGREHEGDGWKDAVDFALAAVKRNSIRLL